MSKLYKIILLTLLFGLNTLFFSQAYNGTDLLKRLVGEQPTLSDTQILYRGILKSSEQYPLLQQAIKQGYIKDKNLIIKLKSEFTNNSLKSWASIYAGVRLPLSGDTPVSQQDWETSLQSIRAGYVKPTLSLPQTIEEIQNELLQLLQSNTTSDQKRMNELIDSLQDPYAQSYKGKKAQEFDNRLQGELIGIGVSLQKNSNNETLIGHIYDGPAKKAGLQPGDLLVSIDHNPITTDLNLSDIGTLIQGEIGSTFSLGVIRNNTTYHYRITREKVTIDPIILQKINQDTTVMTISLFQMNSYESFLKKIATLVPRKNLIIDVRNNLGGSLEDTRQMLNHFIKKGEALYTIKETNGDSETTYSQGNLPHIKPTTSIYFLTNHDTASASEIFIGAIRDYFPTSKIIGTKTYGKGSVQTIRTNDKSETIKFTTGKWFIGKSNRSIDKVGFLPDYSLSDKLSTAHDEVLDYVLQQFINK